MAYGVKCNIRAPHRFMRMGALCWVVGTNHGGGEDRFIVRGMSRGGRVVTTWIDARDLTNFRPGWIPDGLFPHDDPRFPFGSWKGAQFDGRGEAQAWADAVARCHASGPVRPHAASFGSPAGDRS